eukprot:symbB.v1.2.035953.t2/scaffold4964.1/size32361/1
MAFVSLVPQRRVLPTVGGVSLTDVPHVPQARETLKASRPGKLAKLGVVLVFAGGCYSITFRWRLRFPIEFLDSKICLHQTFWPKAAKSFTPTLYDPLVILLCTEFGLRPVSNLAGQTDKVEFRQPPSLDAVEPSHVAYQRVGHNVLHTESLDASQALLKVGNSEKLFFEPNAPLLAMLGRCNSLQQASTGSFLCVLCAAPAKNMFGKPHGSFGIPSPLFRVPFAVSTAKSPLTFMPLKPRGALATWSSKEAGNSQRRMIFILGKPLGSGELQVM